MSYTEPQTELHMYSRTVLTCWSEALCLKLFPHLVLPSFSPWFLVFPFAATPMHSWCCLSLSPAPLSPSGSGVHHLQPVFSHTFHIDLHLKGKRPDVRLQRTVGRWKSDSAFNTLIKTTAKAQGWVIYQTQMPYKAQVASFAWAMLEMPLKWQCGNSLWLLWKLVRTRSFKYAC